MTLDDIASIAQGEKINPASLADFYSQSRRKGRGQLRSPVEGVNPDNLAEAGWGVIFAANLDAERQALEPLLALRRQQAGIRYREFSGDYAFATNESKQGFLKMRGAATSGPVEPARMPFYLLLVGSPEEIPFDFQYQLDIQYAVGRIHFDTLEDYARYAATVVAAEEGTVVVEPRAAFVGVLNAGDNATPISTNQLIKPLAAFLASDQKDWEVETLIEEGAYKRHLLELLRRKQAPALLFTASHGMTYPLGDPLQQRYQGALVMQDFRRGTGLPDPLNQCFSGDDADGLNIAGMIAFHFACFGAGTPARNNFYGYAKDSPGKQPVLAERSFLSALPKRLLANGSLAVVGHIDTAFATTFSYGASTAAYESAIKSLAEGKRIGLAMDYFNLRHAELSVGLTVTIDKEQRLKPEVRKDLATRWLYNNDARNFVVVGDPAVKLPLAADPAVKSSQLQRKITELEQQLAHLKDQLDKLPK